MEKMAGQDKFSGFWRRAYWCVVFVLTVTMAIDTHHTYTELAIGKQYRAYQRVLQSGDEELIKSTFHLYNHEMENKRYLDIQDTLIMDEINSHGWPGNATPLDGTFLAFMASFSTLLLGIVVSKPILTKLRAL